MPGEFRYSPIPADWEVPSGVTEEHLKILGVSGIEPSFIVERDIDGVPLPLCLQVIVQQEAFIESLDGGKDPRLLADEIIDSFDAREARYPGVDLWDKGRTSATLMFLALDQQEEALSVASVVDDARFLIFTILSAEVVEPQAAFSWIDRFTEISDPQKRMSIFRAARDQLIERDPSNVMIDNFIKLIALQTGNENWIRDWINTQRGQARPVDWDLFEKYIHDDDLWGEVPMTFRVSCQLIYADIQTEILTGDIGDNLVEDANVYFDRGEDLYPEPIVWAQMRSSIAITLLGKRRTEDAIKMATSLRNPFFMQALVISFIDMGYDQTAVELAVLIPDPKLSAQTLFEAPFKNTEAPVAVISDVLRTDKYPKAKRIAMMEYAYARAILEDDLDMAARHRIAIEELLIEGDQ